MSWDGPGAKLDHLWIAGHSNGGQGVWYALTHMPDSVRGAAPVSAYSSIQAYVPYTFWHESDPMIASIIEKSLSSYRHELLACNARGIHPIVQQHGSVDRNVPVFHSRRMYQLLTQCEASGKYVELEGRDHFFDGVMVTPPLKEFYRNISNADTHKPHLPLHFSIVVPCNGRIGTRGGIFVEQLLSPDQNGSIEVRRDDRGPWKLRTSNIRRFQLSLNRLQYESRKSVTIDRDSISLEKAGHNSLCWFSRQPCGRWEVCRLSSSHIVAY